MRNDETRSKKFFIHTRYSEDWTKFIREKGYKEGYEELAIDILLNFENVCSSQSVLEVGVGEGRFIHKFLERGVKYVGIDISTKMLKRAAENRNNEVDLIVADAENLPFRGNCFDHVFCFATFFFLPNNYKAIKEMGRVTKGNVLIEFRNLFSFIIIASYLKLFIVKLVKYLANKISIIKTVLVLAYGKKKVDAFVNSPYFHPNYPIDPIRLRRFFREAGLKIDYVEGFDLPKLYRGRFVGAKSIRKWLKPVLLVRAHRLRA